MRELLDVCCQCCVSYLFNFSLLFLYLFLFVLWRKNTNQQNNNNDTKQANTPKTTTQLLKLMHSQKDACNIFTYPIV